MHIPFVGMVKLKFFAHFPGDHLAHPVVSRLVLLLWQFVAFAYYVIDGFISVATDYYYYYYFTLLGVFHIRIS